MMEFTIQDAAFPADRAEVERLFRAYAEWVGVDLGFQGFEDEMASLPGRYASPGGAILLLRPAAGGPAQGCVAVRGLAGKDCEMKRLYLEVTARGQGMGAALAGAVIDRARATGYRRMMLDTLDHMGAALRLYERLGFRRIAPYYSNPLPGVLYLAKQL